jgi:hypothetical protein
MSTRLAEAPDVRRRGVGIGLAITVGVLCLGGFGVVHFRVDLFDDYHAGYSAGSKIPSSQTSTACYKAALTHYGNQYAAEGSGYPDGFVAFSGGCFDSSHAHLPFRPWRGVRAALGSQGD